MYFHRISVCIYIILFHYNFKFLRQKRVVRRAIQMSIHICFFSFAALLDAYPLLDSSSLQFYCYGENPNDALPSQHLDPQLARSSKMRPPREHKTHFNGEWKRSMIYIRANAVGLSIMKIGIPRSALKY